MTCHCTTAARRLLFVILGCWVFIAPCEGANLIANGSFETPPVPVGSFTNYPAGSTAITGWTVVGVDSAVTSGSFMQSGITFQAQDGVQYVDLAGVTSNSPSSGVTQTIATAAGSSYVITFFVGSARDTQNGFFFPATVDLSIAGGPRTSYHNPATPNTMLDWKGFSVGFTAAGPATSITFFNGSASNNFLGALDNVSVELVPEPSSIAIALLSMISCIRTRQSHTGRTT